MKLYLKPIQASKIATGLALYGEDGKPLKGQFGAIYYACSCESFPTVTVEFVLSASDIEVKGNKAYCKGELLPSQTKIEISENRLLIHLIIDNRNVFDLIHSFKP